MEARYAIHYSNGYCGCDDVDVVIAKCIEDAQEYGNEALPEYAASYEYMIEGDWADAHGYDEYEEDGGEEFDGVGFYESQEYEDYFSGCYAHVVEITAENEDEYEGYEPINILYFP